jgi:serine/threonine protein kinase
VFFEEGRALAGLSHPNVIRVLNFFRANDTVYMVMEYEHGRTLQELIQKNRAGVTENFIRNVFTKMLNGLREVHSHRCCTSTSSRRTSTCATTTSRC